MSEKPPIYLSAPPIRDYIDVEGEQFRKLLEHRLNSPAFADADSNERLTALSHWAAQAIDLAIVELVKRASELGLPKADLAAVEHLATHFAGDAATRALAKYATREFVNGLKDG